MKKETQPIFNVLTIVSWILYVGSIIYPRLFIRLFYEQSDDWKWRIYVKFHWKEIFHFNDGINLLRVWYDYRSHQTWQVIAKQLLRQPRGQKFNSYWIFWVKYWKTNLFQLFILSFFKVGYLSTLVVLIN